MSSSNTAFSLTDLSSQLSSTVGRASQYTVAIRARRRIPSSGIIWRDGLIVSASHTVRRDGRVGVTLPSGESADATVVARDAETDLVLLRAEGLPAPAPRAALNESSVGSLVLAVGRPGRATTASFGIVSAAIHGYRTSHGRRVDGVLRLDLSVYDGFSGGPLVAASGGVIGLNNSALAGGAAAALPASVIDSIVDDLLSRGHVRRPYLGVAVHPVTVSAATVGRLKLDSTDGLLVLSIADETPAERAGMLVGDVLLRINGTPLAKTADLFDALLATKTGDTASIDLLRGGDLKTLNTTPVDRNSQGGDE
ncbi:MAG TPA: S1C family serine protease [Gemmatimonadaceae bacterium]|nr:S1C family serine protease [Gemmatimonadaceae bacterium]